MILNKNILVECNVLLFSKVTLTLYMCPHFFESKGCNFSSPKNVTLYSFLYTIGQNSLVLISTIFKFADFDGRVDRYLYLYNFG